MADAAFWIGFWGFMSVAAVCMAVVYKQASRKKVPAKDIDSEAAKRNPPPWPPVETAEERADG